MADRKRTFEAGNDQRGSESAQRSSTIAVSVVPPVARRSAPKRPPSGDPTIAAPVLPRLPSNQATLAVSALDNDEPTPRHTLVASAKPNFRQKPTVFDDAVDIDIEVDADAPGDDGEFDIPLDDEPTLRVAKRSDPTTARQRAMRGRTPSRRSPTFEHFGVSERGLSVWLFAAGIAALCGSLAFALS